MTSRQRLARRRLPGWLRRSLGNSFVEAMLAELVPAFAGGTVLIAWAIHLRAGPLLITALVALPFLVQVLHLPASWLTARRGARRTAIRSWLAARQLYLVLAALPWLGLAEGTQRALLVAVAAGTAALSILGHNAWLVWMADLLRPRVRGRFLGRRGARASAAGALAALGAATLLERSGAGPARAAVLSGLALAAWAAGGLATWLLARQHPPRAAPPPPLAPVEPVERARLPGPLDDPGARRALGYVCAWNAAVGITAAVFPFAMLEHLGVKLTGLALHGAGVAAGTVASARLWIRRLELRGAAALVRRTALAGALLPLLWLVVEPGRRLWILAIDAVLAGALLSGQGLGLTSLPLAAAPRADRPRWVATFATAGGLSFGAGALGAAWLLARVPDSVRLAGWTFASVQGFFLAAACARLVAALLGQRLLRPAPARVRVRPSG